MNRSFLILGVVFILFTLLFGLIFVYFRQAKQGNLKSMFAVGHKRRSYNSISTKADLRASSHREESEIRIEQVPRQLQKRLLLLFNGDRRTANRLLNAAMARNPGKSIQWCAEKVIFDLQRDRGRY